MTACFAASAALPTFKLDPAAAGYAGAAITADNILISDYATVTVDAVNGTFTESGYLPVTGFQLAGTTFTPTGLNITYGLYFAFTGTGTTNGSFTTLDYTLFGYTGSAATFGFSGNTPVENATGEVALATGKLMSGTAFTIPVGGGKFIAGATATLTFNVVEPSFFAMPNPFYGMTETSFTHTSSQVTPFSGGFRISDGGGSLNFVAAPVPEPTSIAMLLAGLGVVGMLYRRRSGANQR